MKPATVSVIVTAHNSGDYLDKCLSSIEASTHEYLEIILVNDGSTDGTGEIAAKWASRDDRIRLEHTEHRGRRKALVCAHGMATGNAHCWVDADDIVDPTAIARCLDKLDDTHQLVYTHRTLIDAHGASRGPDPRNKIPYQPRQLLVDNMIFHLRMFTADLFERSGGVGALESAIDWDMNLRMVEHTTPRCIPRPLYRYRISPNRMTGRPDQIANAKTAIEAAIERRGLPYQLVVDRNGWHLAKQ